MFTDFKSCSPLWFINDYVDIFHNTPFNVCVEVQFLLLLSLSVYDAFFLQKDRFHRIVIYAAFMSGVAVLSFVVLHPQMGNVYFSQFIFMLFDHRLPAIGIVGAFTWFSYIAVTFPWHMNFHSILAEYAFTNLLVAFLWSPFEIMATHFLLWSWHNDDHFLRDRYGKHPIAATLWIMAWISGFQFMLSLYRWYYSSPRSQRKPVDSTQIGHGRCLWIAANVAVGGTIWANVPFNFWFHPLNHFMEWHSSKSLHCYQLLCAVVVAAYSMWNIGKLRLRYLKKPLYFRLGLQVLVIYGYGSTALMAHFEDIGDRGFRSTSYHQTLGERKGTEWSYWKWFERRKHVIGFAVNGDVDNYDFRCLDYGNEIVPALMEAGGHLDWYPLCVTGLEQQFVKQFFILLFIGILLAVVAQTVTFEHRPKRKEKGL